MSYSISITQTDFGQFPIPGVDNDTQGFRDRFSLIQDKFDILDVAVNSLDLTTVKTNQDNDFDGNSITGSGDAVRISPSLTNTAENAEEIQWVEYSYFSYNVETSSYLRFADWPTVDGMLGKITVQLTNDNASPVTVTFLHGTSDLKLSTDFGGVDDTEVTESNIKVTIAANTTKIYEFLTPNRGLTIFGKLYGTFA
jgi:hypothetical protein